MVDSVPRDFRQTVGQTAVNGLDNGPVVLAPTLAAGASEAVHPAFMHAYACIRIYIQIYINAYIYIRRYVCVYNK